MHLLVAIDDSAHARACIQEVASRLWPEGTLVRVLTATGQHPGAPLPQPALPHADGLDASPGIMSGENQYLEGADTLERAGLRVQVNVREGTPGTEIVQEASEWPADFIMMGSRGHGAIKRVLLGSVATYVVTHAPCSVEVVRERSGQAIE